MENFIRTFEKTDLRDGEKVTEGIAALIRLKQTVDINLSQPVSRNWGEVTSGDFLFDRLEKEVMIFI